MKKMYSLLLFVVLSIGCATLNPTIKLEPLPEQVTVSKTTDPTNPAQPIEVQAGDAFNIIIDSNPTTGYHWEIIGELNGVEFISREYMADEPVLAGSGGMDIWTFKAVSIGQVQITFGSFPPSDAFESERTVAFIISVK